MAAQQPLVSTNSQARTRNAAGCPAQARRCCRSLELPTTLASSSYAISLYRSASSTHPGVRVPLCSSHYDTMLPAIDTAYVRIIWNVFMCLLAMRLIFLTNDGTYVHCLLCAMCCDVGSIQAGRRLNHGRHWMASTLWIP